MPFVEVSSSTGTIKFHYTISTPACANAETIDPHLPVVLFFHAFAFHTIFHSQFSDELLRKFNLVVFDLRWHGYTECDTLRYCNSHSRLSIIVFEDALQLPPCHFVSIDIGSMVALQIAVTKPEYVRSLFIMSHICLEELDVALGYTQYAFSSNMSNLAKCVSNILSTSLFAAALPIDLKNWSPEHLKEYPHSQQALSRISCPVKLLHGSGIVNFLNPCKRAGLDVSFHAVPNAPHYLCADHGNEVNPLIHDFIWENIVNKEGIFIPTYVVSPWDKLLREYGWTLTGKNNYDDEDITVSFPSGNI
ncbi:Alpha/Beta hydrolase protein [Rhodocollybia butyracea]|uniref:Alpha/Beta hydrolase protein n=1 Tax=Rhodocollybia butyracea TaxID=206335 RepID=A0A9P5PUT0_9AGAR|nr:Alpha/Beta hydrolase protein [Rhodocollybia butyracea]